MLIGKLFQIGYTPRGGVEADASARLVRPDPRPRTLGRDDAADAAPKAEVRKAEVRRQAEPGNAGVRSVVIEA
jgi:hypothetical protein